MEPLTGDALKARVAELKATDATADQVATACGYVSTNGKPALSRFNAALMEAHGLALPKARKATKGRGKPLSYSVTVGKSGSIMLAGGYSAQLGLKPGDVLTVAVEGQTLQLTPAGAPATPF
jgi:5-formyltetrahydrofolate cyclo-ligase